VHFAGWKGFISVYPAPDGDEELQQELAPYRATRATVRFPLDRPIPHHLLARMVERLLAQRRDGAS
jgi:uncharacterized protein YdhG (YjbR/CyaY superfamily)